MKDMLENVNVIVKLAFVFSVLLVLVPSPLIELRYFIIPFFVFRVLIGKSVTRLEVLWYGGLNLVVFYMFLYRPFVWPQEAWALQRFMY